MLNLRKKLLVSVFTLMLAIVAVATTTYAWFTMGVDVKVSGIQMEVQGVDGLFVRVVSVNGVDVDDSKMTADQYKVGTFKSELDLSEAIKNIHLSPVTLDEGVMKALDTTTGALADSAVATNSGQYIHIEFEFYSNAALSVYFADLEANVINSSYSWTTPVAIGAIQGADQTPLIPDVAANGSVTAARLANALRIAYTGYAATVTTGQDGAMSKIYAEEAKVKVTPSASIVKPNEYDYAEIPANTTIYQYGTWEGTSTDYYNAISDVDLTSVPKEYTYAIDSTVENKAMDKVALVTLAGDPANGYYGKVTVTVWLEGYDSDCFNAIVNDSAKLSLKFKGVK